MPRHPDSARPVAGIAGSLFSKLAHRLQSHVGELYPLHVGDAWMEPPEGCRMQDLRVDDYPGMHKYTPPHGLPTLIDAIVERTETRAGVTITRDNVQVTAGATAGLSAAVRATVDAGEEVLLLSPYWPLIAGIVRAAGGVPVEVPLFGVVESADETVEALQERSSPRTVGLYVNTPNNPTGRVIPASWLEAIAEWARRRELWIYSDEVYEDYVFEGDHTYCLPLAPERTFAAHSFSKAFAMAGNRCGYVVGPASMMREVRKLCTHSFYCAPTPSQLAGVRALGGLGDPWVASVREQYRELGRRSAQRLGVEEPEGSQFLFIDVAGALDERGLMGFLEDCVDRGLFVAPGESFGSYPTHVRICFTAAPPEVIDRGIDHLAKLLGR